MRGHGNAHQPNGWNNELMNGLIDCCSSRNSSVSDFNCLGDIASFPISYPSATNNTCLAVWQRFLPGSFLRSFGGSYSLNQFRLFAFFFFFFWGGGLKILFPYYLISFFSKNVFVNAVGLLISEFLLRFSWPLLDWWTDSNSFQDSLWFRLTWSIFLYYYYWFSFSAFWNSFAVVESFS